MKTSSKASNVPLQASLNLNRVFSDSEVHPYATLEWEVKRAEITDDTGKCIFEQNNIEVPKAFSELATKILASKYFYGDIDHGDDPTTGGREHSFKQVVDRVAKTITQWGLEDGYFEDAEEARIFEEELTWLLVHQYGAFNSPVWFNLGLYQAYGIGKVTFVPCNGGVLEWGQVRVNPAPTPALPVRLPRPYP